MSLPSSPQASPSSIAPQRKQPAPRDAAAAAATTNKKLPLPVVVSVKKVVLREAGYSELRNWKTDETAPAGTPGRRIYIGRNMAQYVPGATASKWGNPFPLKKHSLEESLQLYERHIRLGPLWDQLGELRGAAEIGCWCKPAPCHGDVLVKLLAERFGDVPTAGGLRAESAPSPTPVVDLTVSSSDAADDDPASVPSVPDVSGAQQQQQPPGPVAKRKNRRSRLQ